jgi:hypothetical protein
MAGIMEPVPNVFDMLLSTLENVLGAGAYLKY